MPWMTWVEDLIRPDDLSTAATRAGFDKSAFSRWKRGAGVDSHMAVRLARAYGASPIEALVATGLITDAEAKLRTQNSRAALREVTAEALLHEVMLRIKGAPTSAHTEHPQPDPEGDPDGYLRSFLTEDTTTAIDRATTSTDRREPEAGSA